MLFSDYTHFFLQGAHIEDGSDVLIECRDVYKSFGEKHILRGVSFKVIFLFNLQMHTLSYVFLLGRKWMFASGDLLKEWVVCYMRSSPFFICVGYVLLFLTNYILSTLVNKLVIPQEPAKSFSVYHSQT